MTKSDVRTIVRLSLIIIIILLMNGCSKKSEDTGISYQTWAKELEYDTSNLYDISLSMNGIPEIPVNINNKTVKLLFDTGTSRDIQVTTAIENQIDYTILGNSTATNADGSYRGDTKSIQIKEFEVFGEKHYNINATLADWRMSSGTEINGTVGLQYFLNKRVTLDYKNKKIAISTKPLSDDFLKQNNYTVMQLIKAPEFQGNILYVPGTVNGQKTIIYVDTGIVPSHIEGSIAAGLSSFQNSPSKNNNSDFNKLYREVPVVLGNQEFKIKNIFEHPIKRGTDFEYPVTMVLGSDQLKNFLVTIDKIDNRLILKENK